MKSNTWLSFKIFIVVLLTAILPGTVHALSISIFNVDDQQAEIDNWINNLGGEVSVIEDFENSPAGWYKDLNTNVGKFEITTETKAGTGSSSYYSQVTGAAADDPYFELRNYPANGRYNTTPGGSKYIDSADISELHLDVKDNAFHNLFFLMTDPSDVKARTITEGWASSLSVSDYIDHPESNNDLWFIGINAGSDYITDIYWNTTIASNGIDYTNDGYGLDDFSNVAPVPEPATMLLFGTGLVGLAGARFRRKKK